MSYVCAYSSVQLDKSRLEKEFTAIIMSADSLKLGNQTSSLAANRMYHWLCVWSATATASRRCVYVTGASTTASQRQNDLSHIVIVSRTTYLSETRQQETVVTADTADDEQSRRHSNIT